MTNIIFITLVCVGVTVFGIIAFKLLAGTDSFTRLIRVEVSYNQRLVYWLYFVFIFILCLTFFTYVSIYRLGDPWTKNSDFLNFYLSQLSFIKGIDRPFLLLGVVAIIALVFVYFKIFLKRLFSIKKYVACILTTLIIGFLGFNLSFVGSYLFSIGELMSIEYKLSKNPVSEKLLWDPNLISQKLNDAVIIPEIIIASDNINEQIVSYVVTRKGDRGSFYKKVILKRALDLYPINFAIPEDSSIVMFDNNLYIRNFKGDSFQTISPSLGRLLVRNEFGSRSGKDTPFIQILEEGKYQSFRIHQINSRLRELAALIDKLNYAIGLIKKDMAKANGNINYYKGLANDSYSQGDSAYSRCLNAEICSSTYMPGYCGYYFCSSGYYIRNCTPTFSPSYCFSLKESYYDDGNRYMGMSNYWVGEYNDLVAVLNEVNDYKEKATFAKSTTEFSRETIPFELGVFFPDNDIKIAISSTEANMTSEYISTLIHEYLHYDSHVSKEKSLPHFFEEGLTEYFSRETQKSGMGTDIDLGYPLITSIIKRLAEKIPEQELKDVYYSKDADALTALLNRSLGKDFFEKNEYYFTIISYLPSQTAIDMANSMLKGLDLPQIEENELYKISSSMKLN